MIIRFSCGIVKADHKSIFLSKSCEIIFMEISHIFTQYFHLSSRVISAHRMSCWKILFLFKVTVVLWCCGWCMKPETTILHVDDQLALNDQNQRQNFWELCCLYFPINQAQGKGGETRDLQLMDCSLPTSVGRVSASHVSHLRTRMDIFVSDNWNGLIVSIARHETNIKRNICYQIW